MRTGLVLPYMLRLDVISFSEHVFVVFLFIGFQQKKKLREDAELYFFLLIAFQILLVFLPDNSVHYAFIKYAYTGSRTGQNLMIKEKGTFSLAMTQVLNATTFTIQILAKL
jgi:phosphoglycerol transferase MdoB-like AlkP superfamily enzyme